MSSEHAKRFLESWITQNVHGLVPPENNMETRQLVKQCIAAAAEQGISRSELEGACGQTLLSCMRDAQAAVAEVRPSELMDDS
ncbi:MAG TPA: hypothetical protein VIB38_14100 [Aestuariivirgaceae bacterium]|jgi:hypothetical protein